MLDKLECNKRAENTKPNALRREGLIPAVLYGHNGSESVSLTIHAKTLDTLLRHAKVNKTVIDLNVPDISWNGKTVIQELQVHPWRRTPYHVSFFAVKDAQ